MNRFVWKGTLSIALGCALLLGLASTARATACSDDQFVLFGTSFNDCAGNQNFLSSGTAAPALQHDPDAHGAHAGDDWFSDLHITFLDDDVQGVERAFFLHDSQNWNVQSSNLGEFPAIIWFVAPAPADRVDPGENYEWETTPTGDFSGLNGLNIRIAYTMDVPEPGTGLLLMAGMLGLVVWRQRH
jgi:hypothetical protein